ncbi:MAG: twin-arginine translocase TatA/TatE family subunit [Planctomycetota bacterium]
MEWIIIGAVALLIFGRRLPDVARSFGKSIIEFKKGLRDVHDEIDTASKPPDSQTSSLSERGSTSKDVSSTPGPRP